MPDCYFLATGSEKNANIFLLIFQTNFYIFKENLCLSYGRNYSLMQKSMKWNNRLDSLSYCCEFFRLKKNLFRQTKFRKPPIISWAIVINQTKYITYWMPLGLTKNPTADVFLIDSFSKFNTPSKNLTGLWWK